MKHRDEDPLLQEIVADEPLAELRRASRHQGLEAVRRARRLQRARRAGALALIPVVLILAISLHQRAGETPRTVNTAAAPREESGVRLISDEELFTLFPGRALALVGKPGQQQLVFLDTPPGH